MKLVATSKDFNRLIYVIEDKIKSLSCLKGFKKFEKN